MRSTLLVLACLGLISAQLSPEDQSFIDAALGSGGGEGVGIGVEPPSSVDTSVPKTEKEYKTCEKGTKFCVPYFLCENGKIVTDGAGVIDLRFGGSNNEDQHIQHSDCDGEYTSVCCSDPNRVPPPSPEPYRPQCGRRNDFGVNARIVGIHANETQFGEYPWMAAVLKEDAGKLVFLCGAGLISPNVLATAAHCVYGQENLIVRLGEWDTQHTTEFYAHVDADVANVVIHERYNHPRQNLHNDIALLFLAGEVPLQEHIDTICLPEPHSLPVPGIDCYATGWGKDSFGKDGDFQLVLKQVTLPLVDHSTCQGLLRHTRLGQFFNLDKSFICAGGNGADTCTGDGGSPMVCPDVNDPSRYVLRGIVSWGVGCGDINVPGVYVDVTYFSEWIHSQITNHQPLPWIQQTHQIQQTQARHGWWRGM